MINEITVRRWWDLFQSWRDFPLVEIRMIEDGGKKITSGYFSDVDTMISELRKVGDRGIYATINEINEACYERTQKDHLVPRAKSTTKDDQDITRRVCLFIDLDPERPDDTNATDEELELAKAKARSVFRFMRDNGFNDPIVAMSSNGVHLYYRVDVPCAKEKGDEGDRVFTDFFSVLSKIFTDDNIKIDTSIANRSRVAKLIGTVSPKGAADSVKRPQRESYFMSIPQEWKVTDFAFVKKIADREPKPEAPSYHNNYGHSDFDLDRFISEHNIGIAKRTIQKDGSEKLVLDACPFCGHKAPDSAIFRLKNGGYGFLCFHNSCSGLGWKDFRLHYDPNAYDKKDRQEFEYKRRYYAKARQEDFKPVLEDTRGKKWKMASEFERIDYRSIPKIPMGIPALDKRMRGGLFIGETTIVSGSSGAGKTTFLNHLILNAVERNFRVALWSGEMSGPRVISWLDQAAAGASRLEYDAGLDCYITPDSVADKVNRWLGDRFYLYNNSYGQKFEQLIADIRDCVTEKKVQIVMIDNRMSVDLDDSAPDENTRDKKFITTISDIAKELGIHIVIVCHPRKENLSQIIRKESIAGSADLTNRCDNLILLHRVNRDFSVRAQSIFSNQQIAAFSDYNLIVELNKARTAAVTDYIVGLYYEEESRRLKNTQTENIVYGWDEQPVQQFLDLPPADEDEEEEYDDLPL